MRKNPGVYPLSACSGDHCCRLLSSIRKTLETHLSHANHNTTLTVLHWLCENYPEEVPTEYEKWSIDDHVVCVAIRKLGLEDQDTESVVREDDEKQRYDIERNIRKVLEHDLAEACA